MQNMPVREHIDKQQHGTMETLATCMRLRGKHFENRKLKMYHESEYENNKIFNSKYSNFQYYLLKI